MSMTTASEVAGNFVFTQGMTRYLAPADGRYPAFLDHIPAQDTTVVVRDTIELYLQERARYVQCYRKSRKGPIHTGDTVDMKVEGESLRVRVPAGSKLERCASALRAYIANVELLGARGGVELVQLTVEFRTATIIDRLLIRHYNDGVPRWSGNSGLPRGRKLA